MPPMTPLKKMTAAPASPEPGAASGSVGAALSLMAFGAGLTMSAASAPAAARFESHDIHRKGAWAVELVIDTQEGGMWCGASTRNSAGQNFELVAFETGLVTLYIQDPRWDIAARPLSFVIDVDYERWTITGQGDGQSISINLEDQTKAVDFLTDLAVGSAVAVMNADMRRLGVFSLRGSSESLVALVGCRTQIMAPTGPTAPAAPPETDPFVTSADPFL